ncbi:unnamed protein product [Rotaria sp. Silwood2]|nr:unnamed protein product [Rotaria sp. Silwood2]
MNQIKRQLSVDKSYDEEIIKLRNFDRKHKSITSIENLSNELFIEFFDYLDGCDIYEAFSTLNIRFQHLCSSVILKINLSSSCPTILQNKCCHIIFRNKHRIMSLFLSNILAVSTFFKFGTIDSSFNHLESLVLIGTQTDHVMGLLIKLTFLPRLYSLTIILNDEPPTLVGLYGIVFKLPFLKYYKISSKVDNKFVPFLLAINKEYSCITHLVIDHLCTLNQLIVILSYTPQLRRLSCEKLSESYPNTTRIVPIKLSYVKQILLFRCELEFENFEMFITCISSQVQELWITTSNNPAYLNADRWEILISQHIPYLRKFFFLYHEPIHGVFQLQSHHKLIRRFTSLFWIERRWCFELNIENWSDDFRHITFVIYPLTYEKKWYEFHYHTQNDTSLDTYTNCKTTQQLIIPHQQKTINSSINLSQDTRLILVIFTGESFNQAEKTQLFIDQIRNSFTMIDIIHLEVSFEEIFVGTLIKFIQLFPNLNSLQIAFWSLLKLNCLYVEDSQIFHLVKHNNKITKVSLRRIRKIEDIYFLIDLFPQMQYLEIDCTKYIDPKLFLRSILPINTKCIGHLSSLCLYVQKVNDELIQKLQKMIDLEKLLSDYTIKCINKQSIYLQWK